MQTVYTRGGAGGGSQQREVADGADVVFTDTDLQKLTTARNKSSLSKVYSHLQQLIVSYA